MAVIKDVDKGKFVTASDLKENNQESCSASIRLDTHSLMRE